MQKFIFKKFSLFTPFQSLTLGYFLIAFIGAAILTLPIASANNTSQSFVDAFFTASSAITTTGLIVVDTGTYYSLFGQIVILVLFQIGGLGYMIFFGLILYLFRRKPSLKGRLGFQESLVGITLSNAKKFIKRIVLTTLFIEIAGTILLTLAWRHDFPINKAVYQAFFHSVSAFCTAGFSLFPDSITTWKNNGFVNIVILIITLAGSLGFFVLFDLGRFIREKGRHRLHTHTKLVLITTAFLIIAGTIALAISNPPTASDITSSALFAQFQAASASTTTGFNTVDIGAMNNFSLLVLILLMVIGASPGGTGGGIKTSTTATALMTVRSTMRNQKDINIFSRRIARGTADKAIAITIIATLIIFADFLILSLTEKGRLLGLLFETVSALGTVGLSTGVTPNLTVIGRIIISITMLAGRIGPLAVAVSFARRKYDPGYRYPEAEIFVG